MKVLYRSHFLIFAFLLTSIAVTFAQVNYSYRNKQTTFCNPLNLDYRFTNTGKSYREAADPLVVLYKDNYYLFASHCSGYWWSPDFQKWTFVKPSGLDIEKYAPSVWFIGDTMYYTSSSNGHIYKTADPKTGNWSYVSHPHNWNDPWVFVDTDGKVYAYYGSSSNGTIDCVQLDPNNNFKVIGNVVHCIYSNSAQNGFEVNGENNESGNPWTEGPVMLKHKRKYYLLYATPGTEKRSYCDAYYVADSPMGPYTFGKNSPVTRKSLGYVTGTGHGGLFYDKTGKLWTITCVSIANKSWFERRLAIFPVDIDKEGYLFANTSFGDYPQFYPGISQNPVSNNTPRWNLLSKGRKTSVSSTYELYSDSNAVDENIRTYWSAKTGNAGEWLMVDLGKNCTIEAIQSNFYELNTTYASGRDTVFSTKYKVEFSTDNVTWKVLIDKSNATTETPHDYVQLDHSVNGRYVRVTNMGLVPGHGNFSLSDFRIFGKGPGLAPKAVNALTVTRLTDKRCADISWEPVKEAHCYIIRYGIAPDKLWNHYQVWSGCSFPIKSLVADQTYYFRIDACNDSGVTHGTRTISSGE